MVYRVTQSYHCFMDISSAPFSISHLPEVIMSFIRSLSVCVLLQRQVMCQSCEMLFVTVNVVIVVVCNSLCLMLSVVLSQSAVCQLC